AHEAIYGQQPRHHSSWTHELLAGGAGFAGSIHFILILTEREKINTYSYFY
ncbi:unnamed protein product, partial [Rotaria sp. Silwood1]